MLLTRAGVQTEVARQGVENGACLRLELAATEKGGALTEGCTLTGMVDGAYCKRLLGSVDWTHFKQQTETAGTEGGAPAAQIGCTAYGGDGGAVSGAGAGASAAAGPAAVLKAFRCLQIASDRVQFGDFGGGGAGAAEQGAE